MEVVKFKNKKGEYEKLLNFLKLVDKDFYPPLSERCPLKEYLNAIVKDGIIIYLTENNKVIGMIGYYYFSKKFNCAYINTIAVLKEFRGKEFGELLLKKCLSDIKNQNIKKVKTRTWSTNKISIHLYEKFGFKVCNIVKNDRGPGVDSIYFEKKL
jgi:ribosomal protein S18 acetylase RimI-like enzyme